MLMANILFGTQLSTFIFCCSVFAFFPFLWSFLIWTTLIEEIFFFSMRSHDKWTVHCFISPQFDTIMLTMSIVFALRGDSGDCSAICWLMVSLWKKWTLIFCYRILRFLFDLSDFWCILKLDKFSTNAVDEPFWNWF